MAQMLMPKLNEAGDDAVVSEWLAREGDVIAEDMPVIAVETEKVTVEIPSVVSGRIVRLLVWPGETVRAGQPILEVD